MSSYTIRLKLAPYLAEWFINEHKTGNPVSLIRDSAESNLIREYLRQRPQGVKDTDDYNVSIFIPTYKAIEVRTYNYLPPKATDALCSLIYNNFKVSLWQELHRVENTNVELSALILAYMEKHGISGVEHDTNWETIRQAYYRLRKKYNRTRRNKIVKEGEIEF